MEIDRKRPFPFPAVLPLAAYATIFAVLAGCFAFPPLPGTVSREERLSAFPVTGLDLAGDAEVFFDDHQVPFVLAEREEDVPYLLGMVHAHLRLGQMELFRLVSQGRLAEVAGPFAAKIDATIRTLDLGRAVPEIERTLPEETRRWIERFVAGVNDYAAKTPRRPFETRTLGLGGEPFTVRDALCLGRLLSLDINWLRWFQVLPLRNEPGYPELMERLARFAGSALPSFGGEEAIPAESLFGMARPGSNSMVLAPSRSATGGALMANDPHLGLQQPNLWLLAGYRSPAGAAVGMMYPGVPYVLIGRNERIAWGGTNMQGLSSTLYDVSGLPAEAFAVREEKLSVRFWRDRTVAVRDCELGPVISEAPLLAGLDLPPVALRWRGHDPSDEATSMHRVSRATGWEEFRAAFESYAVSGQNLLYADVEGNIGQLLAIEYCPAAGRTARSLPADPSIPDNRWGRSLRSTELPAALNPEAGYLVSANNVPVRLDPALSFLGNSNDRVLRISELIEGAGKVTVEDLMRMQQDSFSGAGRRAALALAERAGEGPVAAALREWDGRYARDSRGAVAYQLVLDRLLDGAYAGRYGDRIAGYLRSSVALHDFVLEDLEDGRIDAAAVRDACAAAGRAVERAGTWGEMHRIRLAHPLGAIPLLGTRYRYGDVPADGSSTTVRKSAHRVCAGLHFASFGQNSRHVSDLSDPDANFFVLLGGQDGWHGSENLLDQVPFFQEGRYLRIPLREESVRAAFRHRLELRRSEARR